MSDSTDALKCMFCKIVRGESEASVVYQDDDVVAFLDTLPINPGHVLVVPRRHAASLKELAPDDGAGLFRAAQRIVAALRSTSLRCEAANLLLNDGAEAGQRVFHVHLHVIPRHAGDSGRLRRTGDDHSPSREELECVAATIRDALARISSAMPS